MVTTRYVRPCTGSYRGSRQYRRGQRKYCHKKGLEVFDYLQLRRVDPVHTEGGVTAGYCPNRFSTARSYLSVQDDAGLHAVDTFLLDSVAQEETLDHGTW